MYEVNGYTYSLEEIKEAAEASGLGLQEYIIKNGMTTTEEAEVKRNNRGKINGFQRSGGFCPRPKNIDFLCSTENQITL